MKAYKDYKDVVGELYFSDPDLKDAFPLQPKVIDGVNFKVVGAATLQSIGGFSGFAIYNVTNIPLALEILSKCNGKNSLVQILEGYYDEETRIKQLLGIMFRNGILEDGSHSNSNSAESRFFSKLVDNTRVLRSGSAAEEQLNKQVVSLVSDSEFPEKLVNNLINSSIGEVRHNSFEEDVTIFLVLLPIWNKNLEKKICESRANKQTTLLIRVTNESLKIGPIISDMTDSIKNYNYQSLDQEKKDLLLKLSRFQLAQITYRVVLLISECNYRNLFSYSVLNNFDRTSVCEYQLEGKRNWDLGDENSVKVDANLSKHIAAISCPPINKLGSKVHENHSTPANMAAYNERPMKLYSNLSAISLNSSDTKLGSAQFLSLLNQTFGYNSESGTLKRNSPSGGDLGSAEAVVVLKNRDTYRYHGITNTLEVLKCYQGELSLKDEYFEQVDIYIHSNIEKANRKYSTFGDNLLWLDCGVSLYYLMELAPYFSYSCNSIEAIKDTPEHLDFIDSKTHKFTYKISFSLSKLTSKNITHFKNRAAHRTYSEKPISRMLKEELLLHVRSTLSSLSKKTNSLSAELSENLTLLEITNNKIFRKNLMKNFNNSTDISDSDKSHFSALINQKSLSSAPLKYAVILDVNNETILKLNKENYFETLSIAGSLVTSLWLKSIELGLGACPAGGMSPFSLMSSIAPSKRNFVLLFSICIGNI